MNPRKLSPKAEELLRRLEEREGKAKGHQAKPSAVLRSAPLDPSWPFAAAPIGALATEHPLDFVGCGKRR